MSRVRRPGARGALRLAAASLAVLALALLAQRARAAEPAEAAEAAEAIAPRPAQRPCDSCARASSPGGPDATDAGADAAVQGRPVAPVPPATFRLEGLRLGGAQALDAAELQALGAPYVGRDVTLGDLESLAGRITALYRERGYFLAQALVPVQTVQGGVVEISIVEGRLGRVDVQVAADAPSTEARVRGFLSPLPPGLAIHAPAYERAMLLLSDQPGLRVTSGLQEGQQTGTTDLAVEAAAAPRWLVAGEADNHGTAEAGRYRVGATVRWLGPLGIGDNLDARVLASDGNALQFGRLAYEAPIGTNGLRAGLGLARVSYALGGAFEALDAQGKADVVDVSLNHPLIRQRRQNLFLRLSIDSRRLTDRFRAVDFESNKRVRGLGLGWTWERRDEVGGGGYFASAGTLYRGDLSILDAQTLAFDQGAGGRRTEGGYGKLNLQFSRLQTITTRMSLYLWAGLQRASGNLDALEKLSLGGARAVRAHGAGDALVDTGQIGTAEWRWSYSEELTPFLFYDAANGRRARRPSATDGPDGVRLRGHGIGTAWARQGGFSLNATLAWRDGPPLPSSGGGHGPRLYVQLQKVF